MAVPLYSHLSWTFCEISNFRCPSDRIISYFVQLRYSTHPPQHSHFRHIHLLILCFLHGPCLGPMHHRWSFHCFYILPCSFTLGFLSHSTPETFFQFLQPVCTLNATSASNSPPPRHCRAQFSESRLHTILFAFFRLLLYYYNSIFTIFVYYYRVLFLSFTII